MVQAKNSQPNPGRAGLNREQARRGAGLPTPGSGRAAPPVVGTGARRKTGGNPVAGISNFVRSTRSEMRKVTWPSPIEARNLTVVVIALSVLVAMVLGGADFLFQELFRFLLRV